MAQETSTNDSNAFAVDTSPRYLQTPIYSNKSDGLFYGMYSAVEFSPSADDSFFTPDIKNFGMRMDLVSYQVYGTADYWWVLLQANGITNPFDELVISSSNATSPVVYGVNPDETLTAEPYCRCFKLIAKQPGSRFNSNGSTGLVASVTANSLSISLNGQAVESFSNLSPFPSDGASFWGSIPSKLVKVQWLSPLVLKQSEGGMQMPPSPFEQVIHFSGGGDARRVTLRCPSITHINSKLHQ